MALVAGSLLGWELLLTRLASLRYHFHFGHLAVSNGLLGVGAAAVWLGVERDRWQPDPMAWLIRFIQLYAASLVVCTAVLYALPVHLGPMNAVGTIGFAAFATASLAPFVSGGLVVGLLLAGWPRDSDKLYGVDLLAAGAACLLVPWLLPKVNMAGALLTLLWMATAALAIASPNHRKGAAVIAFLGLFAAQVAPLAPSKIERRILQSTWTPLSRIDVVDVPLDRRTVRARGKPVRTVDVPPQVELMQDGSASTLLSDFSGHPEARNLLSDALYSGATRIRPNAEAFVIGFGGGDDVWSILGGDPARVDAVDLHRPILDAHTHGHPEWSKGLITDDRVHLMVGEGRATLAGLERSYDIVQLTGIDTWAAMNSGAFMLAENYLYTTESFGLMLDALKPNGVLQITRMAAEMETLRVLVQLRSELAKRTQTPFDGSVFVVGSIDHQIATIVRPDGFDPDEVNALQAWADRAGLIVHHSPEGTQSGLVSEFINTENPTGFVDAFPRNIAATTDQSPYFFQFTRWTRPTIAADAIREPTYISQGNPLWVAGLAAYSIALAALMLFAPLWTGRRTAGPPGLTRYFAGLGMGYIMIELALMHKITLLVGHPMRAFAITLAGMLISSGLGSLSAHRIPSLRWLPAVIAGGVLATESGLDALSVHSASWSVGVRCAAALCLVLPIGFALGLPFAHRIARTAPEHIPWAWATNALFSVIGSVAVIAVSMTASFSAVLWMAVAIYALALVRNPESND